MENITVAIGRNLLKCANKRERYILKYHNLKIYHKPIHSAHWITHITFTSCLHLCIQDGFILKLSDGISVVLANLLALGG